MAKYKLSKKKVKKVEAPFLCITNEPSESKVNILQIIYQAVHNGQLAYMDGMDPDTGEIVPLLVGLAPDSSGTKVSVYPLADIRMLTTKNITQYLVPDGRGNYQSSQAQSGETEQSQSTTAGESTDRDPETGSAV